MSGRDKRLCPGGLAGSQGGVLNLVPETPPAISVRLAVLSAARSAWPCSVAAVAVTTIPFCPPPPRVLWNSLEGSSEPVLKVKHWECFLPTLGVFEERGALC